MIFEKFTKDLFDKSTYSRNEIDLFTADFLARLHKREDPFLSAEDIATTINLHTAFKKSLGKLASSHASQKGETINRVNVFDAVLEFMSRKEGFLKSEFGVGSAIYTEFYPGGVTEYIEATVEGIKDKLVRYVTMAEKHKKELGEKFLNDAKALNEAYIQARDTQSGIIAEHKINQSSVRKARKELTLQLTQNLLCIAAKTLERPNAFNSCFNFALLTVDNDKPRHSLEEDAE